MQILLNEQNYITSYAIIGCLLNSIQVENPEDLQYFQNNFQAYYYDASTNSISFDSIKSAKLAQQTLKTEIRTRRERECFSIVDRSQIWYNTLTEEQKAQLQVWYQAWLDAPQTLEVPKPLDWM